MRLYKRGAIWWARWSERGRYVRKSTKQNDREAARRTILRWQRELADPTHKTESEATLRAAAERFLEGLDVSGASAGTINMYECKVSHLIRIFGNAPLSAVTYETVTRYITTRRRETAKDHTIHRELTALRRTLQSAQRAGEFKRPIGEVLPKLKPGYEPRTHYLTREQVAALLAHLEPARAAQVAFVVCTGARRGEIGRARRSDLRTDRAAIRGTKTAKARREVPIVSLFADLWSVVARDADGAGDTLFSPWTNMRRDVAAAAKRAGVPAATWNDLRRTFATWLVQAGVATDIVARLMGHANSNMVQRVYGQQNTDSLAHLVERAIVPVVYATPRTEKKERK